MHLLISWRNIWRHPGRTGIILGAVIIGAWSMLLFAAISRGMAASTLSNALNTLTGHIQIQEPAYRDDPVIEHRIEKPGPLADVLNTVLPPGAVWAFRIRVNGVAANARESQGITIVGIDPEKEKKLSFYGDHMAQGRLLTPDDSHGIVVGQALADTFETGMGRKLVLMTQGADRETASKAFKIQGIFKAELESTEKRVVFITLKAAQSLLGVDKAVTLACIRLPDRFARDQDRVDRLAEDLGTRLPDSLTALPWSRLLPLLNGYLSVFDSFMMLWYLVVFTAMAFGLVNTMLMAVLERTREFGLLKALGMRPSGIVRNVLLESAILIVTGLIAGNLLGAASIRALSSGIDLSFMARGSDFLGMGHIIIPMLLGKDLAAVNLVILVLGIVVCLYPAVKAGRVTPVDAMARI